MAFFADIQYAETFYGSDSFGLPPGGPANLNAYQNNITSAVLYWTLNPAAASFHDFVWTVETDTDESFASADLRTYITSDLKVEIDGALIIGNTIAVDVDAFTVSVPFNTDSDTTLADLATAISGRPNVASAIVTDAGAEEDDKVIIVRSVDIEAPVVLTSLSITGGASQTTGTFGPVIDFIEARGHKGVAVPIYTRLQGETRTMHWRVKGTRAALDTTTIASTFEIPQAIDEVVRDASLELMPDPVYKKGSDSNNYNTHWVFGKSIDDHHTGDVFAENDIGLTSVRDISLQSKFGDYVEIDRPQNMKAIDFREIMRQFWAEARFSPTVRSVRNVVRACLYIEPNMTPIRDTLDLYVDDDTVGTEVAEFYIPDDDFWQLITFDAALVVGNTYTVDVDGTPVATPFDTDSDLTMQFIASNIAGEAGVSFAAVVDVSGSDNDRVIVIQAANPSTPPLLTNSFVTGGASQAGAVPTSAGTVLPATVWDNVHLAGGVIIEVTNLLGAIVTKDFLQGILRKLVLANFPLYVTGI